MVLPEKRGIQSLSSISPSYDISGIILRARYVMSGTGLVYSLTHCPVLTSCLSAYGATPRPRIGCYGYAVLTYRRLLRKCGTYIALGAGKCGSDVAYGATPVHTLRGSVQQNSKVRSSRGLGIPRGLYCSRGCWVVGLRGFGLMGSSDLGVYGSTGLGSRVESSRLWEGRGLRVEGSRE
eukprot:1965049-Rhodomonas_salina.2